MYIPLFQGLAPVPYAIAAALMSDELKTNPCLLFLRTQRLRTLEKETGIHGNSLSKAYSIFVCPSHAPPSPAIRRTSANRSRKDHAQESRIDPLRQLQRKAIFAQSGRPNGYGIYSRGMKQSSPDHSGELEKLA